MFYIITYEDGTTKYGEFEDYEDCLYYAEYYNQGSDYTIEEYESEESYLSFRR